MRSLCILGATITCLSMLGGAAAAYDLDDSIYINRQLGLKVDVLEGWTLHQQTGYPSILMTMLHDNSNASISLATGDLKPEQNLRQNVMSNRDALRKVGLKTREIKNVRLAERTALQLDLSTSDGSVAIQQLYQLHGGRIFILTLSCAAGRLKQRELNLVQVFEGLQFTHVQPQGPSEEFERPRTGSTNLPDQEPSSLPSPTLKDLPSLELEEVEPGPKKAGPEPGKAGPGPGKAGPEPEEEQLK